jgi:hypothetical protein
MRLFQIIAFYAHFCEMKFAYMNFTSYICRKNDDIENRRCVNEELAFEIGFHPAGG